MSDTDMSSLVHKADEFGRTVDAWNNVYVVGLVVALIAGAVTLAASYITISTNRKLAVVNADIGRAKDAALEAEKIKRVEMAKSLMPRAVTVLIGADGKSNIDPLKEFSGTEVIIWYAQSDGEARRAAQYLSFELQSSAGWKVIQQRPDVSADNVAGNGVRVESYANFSSSFSTASPEEREQRERDGARSRLVADTLVDFLASEPNNWEKVKSSPEFPNETLRPNQIRVVIAPQPMEYFDDAATEALPEDSPFRQPFFWKPMKERREEEKQERQRALQSHRERLEYFKKMDEERKRREEHPYPWEKKTPAESPKSSPSSEN